MNANDVMTYLGVSYAGLTNADTVTVPRVDGGTHLRKRYFRSPGNYTGTVDNPIMDYNATTYANEPWVYLNLFVSGNVDVNSIVFSGSNYEIDNLTVATTEAGPRGDMVLVKNVLGTPPAAQTILRSPSLSQ